MVVLKIKKYFTKQKLQAAYTRLKDVRVLVLFAFLAVVLMISWNSLQVLQRNYELYKQENELRQLVRIQQLKNQNLELKNVYLKSDEYLELTARRQFSKGLEGERLYFIPEQTALARTKDLASSDKPKQDSQKQSSKYIKNINAWMDFIFHR